MQCQKCNQSLSDNSQFCPYCGEVVLSSTETKDTDIKKKQKSKRILSAILCFLIFAIPGGIRIGLREYNRAQQKQETAIPKIDVDKINEILDSDTEEEQNISGTQTGDVYENNFFGIGCKLKGWTFLSQEELLELKQQSADGAPDEENLFFAFKAIKGDGLADVNMLIAEHTLGENPDEKYGLELMADQLSSNEGIKYCECVEVNIGGENKYVLKTISENDNTDIYIYQFLYFHETKYAVITITASTDDEAKNICQQFYKTDTE